MDSVGYLSVDGIMKLNSPRYLAIGKVFTGYVANLTLYLAYCDSPERPSITFTKK